MRVSCAQTYPYVLALAALVLALSGCRSRTPAEAIPQQSMTPATVNVPTAILPQPTATTVPVTRQPSATPTVQSTAMPSPIPAENASNILYVVKEGDTLSGIAIAYGVAVAEITAANELTSTDLIYIDQELIIPGDRVEEISARDEPAPATRSSQPLPADPSPVTAELITHGDRSRPYVALTFDACQTTEVPSGYDAALINVLIDKQAPATLFLGGLWMQSHPTQTQALAANPLFEVGNHSWSHPDFADLDPETMRNEIQWTQTIVQDLTSDQGVLFRLPFGTYSQEALDVIAAQGLYTIQWDVVTGDPDPNVSAEAIVETVTREAQNGSIVIMHMNTRGWHTAEALPQLIDQLREDGYKLVTVSQLLGIAPMPTRLP